MSCWLAETIRCSITSSRPSARATALTSTMATWSACSVLSHAINPARAKATRVRRHISMCSSIRQSGRFNPAAYPAVSGTQLDARIRRARCATEKSWCTRTRPRKASSHLLAQWDGSLLKQLGNHLSRSPGASDRETSTYFTDFHYSSAFFHHLFISSSISGAFIAPTKNFCVQHEQQSHACSVPHCPASRTG